MPLSRRAFTMIEMLVTIGLIFLLATLIIVALRGVRGSANRVVSANALRQMSLAYNTYCTDNKQQLMPGYMSSAMLEQLRINPDTPTGVPFNDPNSSPWNDPNDASSYVWRLAPYLNYDWQTLYVDYRTPSLVSKLAQEASHRDGQQWDPIYGPGSAYWEPGDGKPEEMGISLIPSFGLNSILVGGDDVHGGSDVTALNPWDNPGSKLAATRYSEVKNPSTLIVFAPTVHFDETNLFPDDPLPKVDFHYGYCELRAPWLYVNGEWVRQWRIENNQIVIADGDFDATDAVGRPIGGGWLIARWDQSKLPVGHLDGSVTTEDINNLADDRAKWSPWAVGYNR